MDLNWANLPSELIHLISKNLSDFTHLASFRSVCKPWHVNGSKTDPPHHLPWLIKSRSTESELTFYSSSFNTHTFRLPEASGKILLGSTNRYFLSLDISRRFLSLLNPLTREEIELPFPKEYVDWISPVYITKEKIVLVWGSNDSDNACLGFCKIGDKKWKIVEGRYLKYGHLYFDGKCYVNVKNGGYARIIDEVSGKEAGHIAPPLETITTRPTICKAWGGSKYLIEASGEIFLIFRAHDEYSPIERCYFDIHRLEFSEDSKPKWTQITSIDDHVIFLDQTRGFSLRATERGYKGNCIYFLKYRVEDYEEKYLVCRYDLEERKGEELGYEVKSGGSWFLPSIE